MGKVYWTKEQAEFDRRVRRDWDCSLVYVQRVGLPRLQDVVFSFLSWVDSGHFKSVRPLDFCPRPVDIVYNHGEYTAHLAPDCRPLKELCSAGSSRDVCFGSLPYGYVYVLTDELESGLARKPYVKTWGDCFGLLVRVLSGKLKKLFGGKSKQAFA